MLTAFPSLVFAAKKTATKTTNYKAAAYGGVITSNPEKSMDINVSSNRSASWEKDGIVTSVEITEEILEAKHYPVHEIVAILCCNDASSLIKLYDLSSKLINLVSPIDGVYFCWLSEHFNNRMAVICETPNEEHWPQWYYGFGVSSGEICKISPHK